MKDIRITPDNVDQFPIGTPVRFFWGCPADTGGAGWDGPQAEDGLVVGWAICPASKFSNPRAELIIDTDDGKTHHVSRFITAGIGAYLVFPLRDVT